MNAVICFENFGLPKPADSDKVRAQRVDSAAFSVLRGGEGEGIILYMSCEGGGGGVGWKRIADSEWIRTVENISDPDPQHCLPIFLFQ